MKPEKKTSDFVPYKNWYEIKVDGKILGLLPPPSKQTEAEVKRLAGLLGVKCLPARAEKLIEVNATTAIPKSLVNRWKSAYKKSLKSKPKKQI